MSYAEALARLRILKEATGRTAKTDKSPLVVHSVGFVSCAPGGLADSVGLDQAPERPADIPRAWAEGVSRLRTMPAPPAWGRENWPEPLASDAERFLAAWGVAAHRLGWPTWALWGVHRRAPSSWHGCELVALLHGRPVVALTTATATIRTGSGRSWTYLLPERDPLHPGERALIWDLV